MSGIELLMTRPRPMDVPGDVSRTKADQGDENDD